MKKTFLIFVSVLIICIVFSSCSSVDPIVGEWESMIANSDAKVTTLCIFNEDGTFDMKIVGEYLSGDFAGTIRPLMDTSTVEPKYTWKKDCDIDDEYIVHLTTGGNHKFRIEDGKLLTLNNDGSTTTYIKITK